MYAEIFAMIDILNQSGKSRNNSSRKLISTANIYKFGRIRFLKSSANENLYKMHVTTHLADERCAIARTHLSTHLQNILGVLLSRTFNITTATLFLGLKNFK